VDRPIGRRLRLAVRGPVQRPRTGPPAASSTPAPISAFAPRRQKPDAEAYCVATGVACHAFMRAAGALATPRGTPNEDGIPGPYDSWITRSLWRFRVRCLALVWAPIHSRPIVHAANPFDRAFGGERAGRNGGLALGWHREGPSREEPCPWPMNCLDALTARITAASPHRRTWPLPNEPAGHDAEATRNRLAFWERRRSVDWTPWPHGAGWDAPFRKVVRRQAER